MSKFAEDIQQFNAMYSLPHPHDPTFVEVGGAIQRVEQFMAILEEELREGDEIMTVLEDVNPEGSDKAVEDAKAQKAMVMLTDWLGDIIIYAASEMARYGIPLDQTLEIIMQSNFSKLGADGKAILDDRAKVMKGPNYWKPEPKLEVMLLENGLLEGGRI